MKTIISLIILGMLGGSLGADKPNTGAAPGSFTRQDYANAMRDAIGGENPRVLELGMLGAHDAFTSGINRKSLPDPNNGDVDFLQNPVLRFFASGVVAQLSRTQKSSAYALARHGVRFFDARVTYVDGVWYTSHGLISQALEQVLRELIRFMSETGGEVLVISFLGVAGNSNRALLDYLATVTEGGKSILDYVRYDAAAIPLQQLRYRDVTKGGSGAVLLLQEEPGPKHYPRANAIWGRWHNTNDPERLLQGIAEENQRILDDPGWYKERFIWNQAQLTMQTGWPDALRVLIDWSLLNMARKFNRRLLPLLPETMAQLPIVGVDYADNMNGDWNDKVMEIISAYNRGLA
ncbi:MAG: hypothetical protein FWH26_08950 [Oscillospiraceae bacterium]|nr:hypothetical protein [Oscillospiraceae bacterium]